MRSAFSRRAVAAGLPIAALAVGASTKSIAATDKPDAELLRLGEALSVAWAKEIAAFASGDYARMDVTNDATAVIVHEIEALQATTLAGLIVKARACHWCHNGELIDSEFFGESTTDHRLAAGILGDLIAMGGADA